MGDQFDQKQLEELRDAFDLFDRDADGFIDTKELVAVMASLDKDTDEASLRDMIASADADGNGVVDFPEFLSLVKTKPRDSDAVQELKQAFKVFDKDGNKYISKDELRQVMISIGQNLSAEELNEMIREADADEDGQINYEEFVMLMDK